MPTQCNPPEACRIAEECRTDKRWELLRTWEADRHPAERPAEAEHSDARSEGTPTCMAG